MKLCPKYITENCKKSVVPYRQMIHPLPVHLNAPSYYCLTVFITIVYHVCFFKTLFEIKTLTINYYHMHPKYPPPPSKTVTIIIAGRLDLCQHDWCGAYASMCAKDFTHVQRKLTQFSVLNNICQKYTLCRTYFSESSKNLLSLYTIFYKSCNDFKWQQKELINSWALMMFI